MMDIDFDYENLEDEQDGADEDGDSMTDEASAAEKCASEATEATAKKQVEGVENLEKKEVLSKTEEALVKRIEEAIVKGNVTDLEHAVGSVINNSQSLMRVVRALNSSLGSETIHATASVTNTSDGGYTASVHIGLRHGFAKSSPYTAINLSTNHTLGENGVTRPVASATYYRGGLQGSESIQPADALATMAQQLNRTRPESSKK